jgi:hypothetical protein
LEQSQCGTDWCGVNRDDEYRRNAAEAQSWADKAKSADDRAAWLGVVQGWLGLIRKPRRSAEKSFDEQVKVRDTGQERSDKRH